MSARTTLLSALLIGSFASAAAAQHRAGSADSGMALDVGVGPGWTKVSCDICGDERSAGLAASLTVSLPVSRAVRLGLEANYWRDQVDLVNRKLFLVGPVAYWFVGKDRNLFLKGGALYAHYTATANGPDLSGSNGAALVGMGYRVPLSPRFSIAPFVNVLATTSGKLRVEDEAVATEDARYTEFQAGLSVSWH